MTVSSVGCLQKWTGMALAQSTWQSMSVDLSRGPFARLTCEHWTYSGLGTLTDRIELTERSFERRCRAWGLTAVAKRTWTWSLTTSQAAARS